MNAIAMREAYGDALLELAEDEKVVVLDADLSKATSSAKFAKLYPERFFNMGIAEQNLMGTASGLAISGYTPYVGTFAMFAAGRAYEQVRNAVCYPKARVRIVATHAGLSPNSDGGSHETVEDIALMRVLPNMTVFSPCDYNQAKAMIKKMKDLEGPAYIRLSRHPAAEVTGQEQDIDITKAAVMKEGKDICIVATGTMVAPALEAAKQLEAKGIDAAVINVHTIKPFDEETIRSYANQCSKIITVEEHSVIGGLGSAVCEAVAAAGGCRVERMGIRDRFGQSGDLGELLDYYELTDRHIVSKAVELSNIKAKGSEEN